MKIDPGPKQVSLPTSVENRPAQPQASKRTEAEQTDVSLSPRATQLKSWSPSLRRFRSSTGRGWKASRKPSLPGNTASMPKISPKA